jgi:formimidoylglutamate deiminase
MHGRSGDHLLDNMVFASRGNCIDSVWRRGERLVSAGRHRDAVLVTQRYLAVVDRILLA